MFLPARLMNRGGTNGVALCQTRAPFAGPNTPSIWRCNRWRQLAKHIQVAVAYHGELNISDTTFGPRSSERSDRTLGGASEPHLCVNDKVVETAIAVEIHGQCVRVVVVIVEHSSMFILPGQFGALNLMAVAYATNEGTMKQLRLAERAGAGR